MALVRITPPSYQPITLAQARAQCRIDSDNTAEDTMFSGVWIPAVTEACEQILKRSIMAQTWALTLDGFADEIKRPNPRRLSVTAGEYKDTAGAWQTLAGTVYEVDAASEPGRVVLASGQSWPAVFDGVGVVKITYSAGYASGNEAAQQAAVPASIKQWLLLAVGTAYAHRESIAAGLSFSELPGRTFDGLLDRERVWSG